ncbi:unnamed protein product [Phytophthora fragariaefolia]|uniref:Unnamed protein product n=1 Tax=Phytophthora fragariaefolia TaxID=1490495 RepID=A0A9W6WTE2_9STRA|nr:unnamed protein product [Phytophthora fragariaefolia]
MRKCRTPVGAGRPNGEDISLHDGRMGGTRHGGLAPESLGTLASRKSSDRLLVVHGRVRGYEYPFRILIDSGASKIFARRQSVARNADKFADALTENSGAGPVSVRLANGSLVDVPRIMMDLSVKFEDFDSTERFIVLEMDKYDLILGMPWLEHVPTSVKSKGVRQDRQGASAPEEFMGVAEEFGVPQEVTVDSVKESAEAPPGVKPSEPREASRSSWASCPACGTTKSVDPDTGSRRAVRASTDKVLRAAHQMGNLVPPEQGISRREPSVGNVVPGGVRKALIAWEAGDTASNVGNLVPREPTSTPQVGSAVAVAQGDSEPKAKAPQTRSSAGHYHVFDSETGLRAKADAVQLEALPEVAELLNLEEMSLDDFLADLKAGEISEMVLLRPEPTPEELNSSSVMNKDVLEEFRKQRASRLGSEVLKNPNDPVYPLMKEFGDMVAKDPPSQLPLDRGVRHEIDLVPGTNTPSGMLWEWLVMPQGLSNAPATFNRLVTQLFRPLRAFAQTYFDDIFVHSRAENDQTAIEVHLGQLRRVFEVMRANKLYANIDKCVFGAKEIKVLGSFVSSAGVRADPEKVNAIAAWPTPRSQKDLRKWLGLANYLYKYSAGYAGLANRSSLGSSRLPNGITPFMTRSYLP